MPDMRDDFLFPCKPTQQRPLFGQTVLLVEDSRFASEGVRLMCLRLGARIRRADSLTSARRHLQTYRPTVVLVDLGLPDGSGADLIGDLAAARPRVAVLLATSGDPALGPVAMAAGADAFLDKPLTGLGAFLETILARLPHNLHPRGPRPVTSDVVVPDTMALMDDLAHVSDLLEGESDPPKMEYVAAFVAGLGRSIGDPILTEAAGRLGALHGEGRPTGAQVSRLTALVHEKLSARPLAI
jgi:CheY-like chemotaxis protein